MGEYTIHLLTLIVATVAGSVELVRFGIDEYRYRAARRSAATPTSAPGLRWRIVALLLALLVVATVIAYPRLSAAPAAPAPTAFTSAWLTPDLQITFKLGAVSIIKASGNLPPTKIETVAEPDSARFASKLVDTFILSGFPVQDDGQGNRVGVPTMHRLAPGITISAPVPSLAAEAVRVGLERIGIQTQRSTDRSRTGDYLVVEVGPAP